VGPAPAPAAACGGGRKASGSGGGDCDGGGSAQGLFSAGRRTSRFTETCQRGARPLWRGASGRPGASRAGSTSLRGPAHPAGSSILDPGRSAGPRRFEGDLCSAALNPPSGMRDGEYQLPRDPFWSAQGFPGHRGATAGSERDMAPRHLSNNGRAGGGVTQLQREGHGFRTGREGGGLRGPTEAFFLRATSPVSVPAGPGWEPGGIRLVADCMQYSRPGDPAWIHRGRLDGAELGIDAEGLRRPCSQVRWL